MPVIPLGNFGNQIAQSPGRVNVPAAAFENGVSGLADAAKALGDIASDMTHARAVSEATTEIQRGKLDLDTFVSDIEKNPYDAEGRPRYGELEQGFRDFSNQTLTDRLGAAQTPPGKEAIQKDLGNYIIGLRQKVAETARKQEIDFMRARGTDNLDLAVRTNDERQVDRVITGMVSTGIVSAIDGQKERDKALYRIEYGRASNLINSATTKEALFEARGRLSVFNPKLSPDDNRALLNEVNTRIDRFDRDAEEAKKKLEDSTFKELRTLDLSGKLDATTLVLNGDKLSKEGFGQLAALIDQNLRQGRDDPALVQRLQIGVLTGQIGESELTRIASGYDPGTGQTRTSGVSRETYRQLMADAQQQGDRKFSSPEYKQAREYLQLAIAKSKSELAIFIGDSANKLSLALGALYTRANRGETGHLRWAQDYAAMLTAPETKPLPAPKTMPQTATSGPLKRNPSPPSPIWQIPPNQMRALNDVRLSTLRAELASERSSFASSKTPAERRRAEQNIRAISQELKNLGVKTP